jgi:hypothetical protein
VTARRFCLSAKPMSPAFAEAAHMTFGTALCELERRPAIGARPDERLATIDRVESELRLTCFTGIDYG